VGSAGAAGTPGSPSNRLRLAVFTAGPLLSVNSVFFRRLAEDPLLDLAALVVDEYRRPRAHLARRLVRGLRAEGWGWLWFKLASNAESLIRRVGVWMFERMHPRSGPEESYEAWQQGTGIPVYRVPDIHSEQSVALIRALRPQLGVIVGGRILRDAVIAIPQYGTLNIHKRKVPEYRGGGPVGYWEVLAGEPAIGITVHYATSQVDAGPVLTETTIPIEECDTLESLRIKADIGGALLYHESIRRVALGARRGVPQDASGGTTYRSPGESSVWRLERRLKQKAARTMPVLRERPSWIKRGRVLLQYLLLLPWLLHLRTQLTRKGRAPVCIFFYHMVANHPANHMCLPLEEFVRQVEFLRRYYRVVSLDEAVQRINSEQNCDIAAAITFDDGYESVWAVEYLRYFRIPASFFVSIGNIRDGKPFEHDRRRGFHQVYPMREADVRRLAAEGFVVGSHGVYHEDFGQLDSVTADRVLQESRELIGQLVGRLPDHFSFPRGLPGRTISADSLALATKHYQFIYLAGGGYNFPHPGRSYFRRVGNSADLLELASIMDGYTGFRQCVTGNAWGLTADAAPPC
jgi:peptidoglycan/xylan/chitin deacetylase (PgdA/CDA1 family)